MRRIILFAAAVIIAGWLVLPSLAEIKENNGNDSDSISIKIAIAETFCANVTLSEAYADRPINGYPYLFAIDFVPSDRLSNSSKDYAIYYYNMENDQQRRQLPWLERTVLNEEYAKTSVTEAELREYWQLVTACTAPVFQIGFENGTEKFFRVHWGESQSSLLETVEGEEEDNPPLTAEQLEKCKELGIKEDECSQVKILSRECLGGNCGGSTAAIQAEVLQNPTMLTMFGLLAAGIGGAAAVFYIKTRKGKGEKGTGQ